MIYHSKKVILLRISVRDSFGNDVANFVNLDATCENDKRSSQCHILRSRKDFSQITYLSGFSAVNNTSVLSSKEKSFSKLFVHFYSSWATFVTVCGTVVIWWYTGNLLQGSLVRSVMVAHVTSSKFVDIAIGSFDQPTLGLWALCASSAQNRSSSCHT